MWAIIEAREGGREGGVIAGTSKWKHESEAQIRRTVKALRSLGVTTMVQKGGGSLASVLFFFSNEGGASGRDLSQRDLRW